MSVAAAISLFIIMLTMAALPSSSVALVVTRSVTHGFTNGIAVAIGIVLGDLIFILLAILGLTALSQVMGAFFMVIKYAAAAYLIWLGLSILRNNASMNLNNARSRPQGGLITSFIAGFFLTLGDIKAIFFYASLFPTLVDMPSLSLADILFISLLTIITVGGVKIAYAFLAGKVVAVSTGLKMEKPARITAGSLMMGAGAYLITKN